MVRLLHAADLHLDSPFSALSPEQAARRRQEQRAMLTQLAELANAHECDLVLLAGDLFDSDNAYPDSVDALRRAFASCRAEIVIAPGNHDFCAPGSAYLTETWSENVHIFTKQELSYFEFPRLSCRVWGAAFTAPDAPALLEGFSAKHDGMLELMALHGDALNANSPYNAITREQIAASGLCYLALGHIHEASGLQRAGDTYYAWSGCPMGRGFDELGQKGVYLVTAQPGACTAEFLPISGRKYEILRVPAEDDALEAIRQALPDSTQDDIYRIILTGDAPQPDLAALHRALDGRFFSLTLRDETTPRRELWDGCGEDTLRGLFLQTLRAQYDAAQSQEEKAQIADAVRLGLAAMDGREAPAL